MRKSAFIESIKKRRSAKSILLNILLAVLISALTLLLLTDQIGLSNSDYQVSTNRENPSIYVAKKINASQIYLACVDELQTVLPGLVCWGDIAAVGNSSGSLTGRLFSYVNRALFSDLEDAFIMQADYSNVRGFQISMVNMGVDKEGMNEILARCGASPMLLAEDYQIPLNGNLSNVRMVDETGYELKFAQQKYAKFDGTTICGIPGYLYIGTGRYDADHPHLAFSREYMGKRELALAGTPVETESAEVYKTYTPLLFFDSTLNLPDDAFVEALQKILEHQENQGGYAVVIVHTEKDGKLDAALQNAFGKRYIQISKGATDMREEDYDRLAQTVFHCLDGQGAFDAVKSIVRTTMECLVEPANDNREI